MPRVHFVKSARKDNPAVKKGESYYWWKFRYGGKRYSKTAPKQSQLTQSEFLSRVYALMEEIGEQSNNSFESVEDFNAWLQEKKDEAEELVDMTQESLENIPWELQETHMLTERLESIEDFNNELECVDEAELDEEWDDLDVDEQAEYDDDEGYWESEKLSELVQERLDELQGIEYVGY